MSTRKRISGDYTIQTLNGGDSITLITDEAVVEGNLTVTGNAVLVGNINADRIFNGTSNVEIATPGGNVTVGVGGVNNVLDIGAIGAAISGVASVTGNITAANVNTAGLVTATGNVTGGNINSLGNIFITRTSDGAANATIRFVDTDDTVAGGQIGGTIEWFTNDVTDGPRVTSAIRSIYTSVSANARVDILTSTNGAAATAKLSVLSTGNVGIGNTAAAHLLSVNGTAYMGSTLTTVGNITAGNLITAGSASVTGVVQAGNLQTLGIISAAGNITVANVISQGFVEAGAAGISATGNVTGGNLLSDGIISATGNLTTTDIFATTLSLSGNVVSVLSVSNTINAGQRVDTPLLVTNFINSDDSTAVVFNDGVIVDSFIETNNQISAVGNVLTSSNVSAVGNITGNNIVSTTTVRLAIFADNTARDSAISSPAAGMMIFNSTGNKFQGFDGSSWVDLN